MKSMENNLEEILTIAKSKGAVCAEVYQVKSQSHPIFFEGNRLKQLESLQSEGTALRLWRDARPGLAVAYGNVDPELLVDKAIALALLNSAETIELTPPRTEIHAARGVDTPPITKLIEMGNQTIAYLREEYPELICSLEFEWEQETTTLVNSQGLYCQYCDTSLSYSLGAELVRGEDFLGIYEDEYTKDNLNLERAIASCLQRLDWARHNAVSPTGKLPVIFTANGVTILWETVVAALNGKRVWEGTSPWSTHQGQLVISPLLSLSQQPDRQPYDCPFDDEGTPAKALSLIKEGKLQQFYSDRVIGRELGIGTTGNGFRTTLDSYPSPSLINLIVKSGSGSLQDLITQLDQGIIVDQILGSGADISGDFSVNIDLGYLVEKGKVVGRVKDTAIAGNVYDLLKQVVALGDDCSWSGSYYTPSLMVEGVSVIG